MTKKILICLLVFGVAVSASAQTNTPTKTPTYTPTFTPTNTPTIKALPVGDIDAARVNFEASAPVTWSAAGLTISDFTISSVTDLTVAGEINCPSITIDSNLTYGGTTGNLDLNNAVESTDIAANAVGASELDDSGVFTVDELTATTEINTASATIRSNLTYVGTAGNLDLNNAVDTGDIADDGVDSAEIAANAVGASELDNSGIFTVAELTATTEINAVSATFDASCEIPDATPADLEDGKIWVNDSYLCIRISGTTYRLR